MVRMGNPAKPGTVLADMQALLPPGGMDEEAFIDKVSVEIEDGQIALYVKQRL